MRLVLPILICALTACGSGETDTTNETSSSASKAETSSMVLDEQGVPKFSPGAWEITRASGTEEDVERKCLGSGADADLREALTREFPAGCKVDRKSGPDGIRVEASCPQNGQTIESDLKLTGSDTWFEMELATYVTDSAGDRSGLEVKGSGRKVGNCPAGVQAGEEITGDVG